jgi:hypothetical protein
MNLVITEKKGRKKGITAVFMYLGVAEKVFP